MMMAFVALTVEQEVAFSLGHKMTFYIIGHQMRTVDASFNKIQTQF
jgi:hypothetical protein